MDEWIKKWWYICDIYIYIYLQYTHTQEYYLAIKNVEVLPFATIWIDLEGIMLSEMSDRERQILYDLM